jgi:TRAP-type C4-dicarboxylate transport system permease small subunit
LREGAHIRVVLLVSRLPKKLQPLVEVWCIGFGLMISLYFTWYAGMLTYESYSYNDLSSGMIAVPIWIPQMAMLLGLVVLSVALIDELVAVCRGNTACYVGKGESLLTVNRQSETVSSAAE